MKRSAGIWENEKMRPFPETLSKGRNVKIGKRENVKISSYTILNFLTTIWILLKSYPEGLNYE